MDIKVIGINVKVERIRAELTLGEVAKELGISRQCYYLWEKHPERIKASTLLQLAEIFGCNVNDFFYKKN